MTQCHITTLGCTVGYIYKEDTLGYVYLWLKKICINTTRNSTLINISFPWPILERAMMNFLVDEERAVGDKSEYCQP